MDNTLVGPEGQVVCERCEIAESMFNRVRGLLARNELLQRRGILIRPTWSLHTRVHALRDRRVFLDEEMNVLEVESRA